MSNLHGDGNLPDSLVKMQQQQEMLIGVDSSDTPVEPVEKVAAHQRTGRLHRAFSLFLMDDQGRTLLAQRSEQKPLWPQWWDGACSSHPWWPDESVEAATVRRLPFELGLEASEVTGLRTIGSYEYHAVYSPDWSENEVNHVVIANFTGKPNPNRDEVMDWRWATVEEVNTELATPTHRFPPWFPPAWELVLSQI